MKIKHCLIITIILMLISALTACLLTVKFYPKPIINPSIIYKYDTLPPETTIVSVPDTIFFEFDSSGYIHQDSLEKVQNFYQALLDSANALKFIKVSDFQIFPTNDSVYVTYYYPNYTYPSGNFEYNFFPARDSSIYVLVPNTTLLEPKITVSIYGKYKFNQEFNSEIGMGIYYKSYGIIGGLHFDNNKKITYSIGLSKNFNFY